VSTSPQICQSGSTFPSSITRFIRQGLFRSNTPFAGATRADSLQRLRNRVRTDRLSGSWLAKRVSGKNPDLIRLLHPLISGSGTRHPFAVPNSAASAKRPTSCFVSVTPRFREPARSHHKDVSSPWFRRPVAGGRLWSRYSTSPRARLRSSSIQP
jgi:hypothetical protein